MAWLEFWSWKIWCHLQKDFFDNITMLRFGETKVAVEKLYCTKKTINTCVVNVII